MLYQLDIANFAYPSHLAASFKVTPFEFMRKLYVPKTRVFPFYDLTIQASSGEDLVIVACTVFD